MGLGTRSYSCACCWWYVYQAVSSTNLYNLPPSCPANGRNRTSPHIRSSTYKCSKCHPGRRIQGWINEDPIQAWMRPSTLPKIEMGGGVSQPPALPQPTDDDDDLWCTELDPQPGCCAGRQDWSAGLFHYNIYIPSPSRVHYLTHL